MKHFLAMIATALLLVAGAGAQQSPAAGENSQSQLLDNGTIIYLELSKTLDAKKAKPGDQVHGSVLADVLSHGKIVLRQDTKLLGHISEVQAFSKEKPESRLGVVFDKVLVKGGEEMPLNSVLMAISPAPRMRVESMSAPAPPGVSGANSPQPLDTHYPRPRPAGTPVPPSYKDPFTRSERERLSSGGNDLDMQPTDIEGLTLAPASDGNRVVVSFRNNVKLESGVRLALRVTNPQGNKTQTP